MSEVLLLGNCLEVMKDIPDNSIDSVVTDPPYGLKFMGKSWDYDVPSKEIWVEVLRVLKPGGHLLSFGGTRTYHRMVVAIEDAGFEIRDQIQWLYGSGFPKSHNMPGGIGTALKPANEPIVLARKPISEKTVAANVLKYGTGGLNIDASRIVVGADDLTVKNFGSGGRPIEDLNAKGRWPANILLDETAAEMLDEQSGITKSSGSASRFFYCAKASKRERNAGLAGMPQKVVSVWGGDEDDLSEGKKATIPSANHHPTVKPIRLMEYLIKLITPPNGIVLDPFMGSGSTGVAAKNLGFEFIGIEMNEEYLEISTKRIG